MKALEMFGILLVCAVMILGSFSAGVMVGASKVRAEAQKAQRGQQPASPVKARVWS